MHILRALSDVIIIFAFVSFCYLWFTHGASIQGIYDSHVYHLKEAEAGGLERIRERTGWYEHKERNEKLASLRN